MCDKNIPFSVKWDNLERIGQEIKNALEYYKSNDEEMKLIVIHGGGSFGHPVAKKYMKDGKLVNMEEGFWNIQRSMRRLNNIVLDCFNSYNIPSVSIQPSSFISFERDGLHFDTYVIEKLLERNLIPVIHGDVVVDNSNDEGDFKIFSGDNALPYLSKKFKPTLGLHATDVDGVYDLNGKIIDKIDKTNISKIEKILKPSNKEDITGGMYLKVMEVYRLGVRSIIFNGNKRGNIYKGLLGKVSGTVIN